jgi:DNA-binding transcriptional regulator LsrR (DeoR family)
MTPKEAEVMLVEWRTMVSSRDERVRAALVAGLTKHRISVVSGISRATIDRLLASARDEASDVQH